MALRFLGRRLLAAALLRGRPKSDRVLVLGFEEFVDTKAKWEEPRPRPRQLSAHEADVMLGEAVLRDDPVAATELTARCVEAGRCPSLPNVLYVLSACAQSGDRDTIVAVTRLCGKTRPDYLERYSGFRHFLAEAVWVRGNVKESLRLFREVYRDNAYLRRKVRLALKHLIRDTMGQRSEAAMVNVVAFGEELVGEYGDYFPLSCVWEACLLSEWHHDQTLSMELLERNAGLIEAVTSRIPYVVGLLLRQHRAELVYKILETLLLYDMKPHYPFVLLALLDYQLNRGDLRSCVEIVRWSSENDVPLEALRRREFVDLLSKYEGRADPLVRRRTTSTGEKGPSPQFKF